MAKHESEVAEEHDDMAENKEDVLEEKDEKKVIPNIHICGICEFFVTICVFMLDFFNK